MLQHLSTDSAEFLQHFQKGVSMELLDRINLLCKEKGISRRQMEKEAGLGTGSTSKWKSGYRPNQNSLKKLSDFFGVSLAYLQGESDFRTEDEAVIQRMVDKQDPTLADETRRYEAGAIIPILSSVKCGIPQEAIEEIDWEDTNQWEEISMNLARTGKFFALRIKGDSMSPRMVEGDVVIVRQQDTADSGDFVIAKVNGSDACCKKFIRNDDGITLQSLNPSYAPMYFSRQDIEQKPVLIIGKVVELRGKL